MVVSRSLSELKFFTHISVDARVTFSGLLQTETSDKVTRVMCRLWPYVTAWIMSSKLQNYLRTHRRRAGLSQEEVAFLLGVRTGSQTSHYERFARQPTLETALAYEAIFGTPARELFAGIYDQARADIQKRALLLSETLMQKEADGDTARKLEFLQKVASSHTPSP
jgi:transcriptional regulator with XRE-family HTH domain